MLGANHAVADFANQLVYSLGVYPNIVRNA